jgi:hypothetical protein
VDKLLWTYSLISPRKTLSIAMTRRFVDPKLANKAIPEGEESIGTSALAALRWIFEGRTHAAIPCPISGAESRN